MKIVVSVGFSIGMLLGACSRTPQEPATESRTSASSASVENNQSEKERPKSQKAERSLSASPQTAPSKQPALFKKQGGARVVAIGDLHGDFEATRRAFALAGAIDGDDKWSGGKLIVVQTGDQLDRGDDEEEILTFLKRLRGEAAAAGGALHVLSGNHETMNVLGDFRYVTPAALKAFEGAEPRSPLAKQVPEDYLFRARAFLPGGAIALELAEQPIVVMVGDSVFAHGGVLPQHVRFGLDRLNRETSKWMKGERPSPPAPIMDPDGPLWTRLYGSSSLGPRACAILEETLKLLGAKRLVVGHTVQANGMSAACKDRVFRIDVGLSRYYGDHPVQVLEITPQGAKILTAPL